MTNDTAPEGQVLVQYLLPTFGGWAVSFTTGYFDNPNEYEEDAGDGWLDWTTNTKINVIAYAKLPVEMESSYEKLTQIEFKEKFGSFHPNLGSVGE